MRICSRCRRRGIGKPQPAALSEKSAVLPEVNDEGQRENERYERHCCNVQRHSLRAWQGGKISCVSRRVAGGEQIVIDEEKRQADRCQQDVAVDRWQDILKG